VTALYQWVARKQPSKPIWSKVSEWVRGLDAASWQAPSIPLEEQSNLPYYEHRAAVLADARVWIVYRHEFATDIVDLLDVDDY
jgi:hypothetical protein